MVKQMHKREAGSTLVAVLALIVIGVLLATTFVSYSTSSLRGTEKRRREGQAKLMISGRIVTLNGMARDQMEATGLLDLPQLVQNVFPEDSGADEQSFTYSATTDGVNLVVATHGLNPLLLAPLEAQDDPFRGALALSASQTLRASAVPLNAAVRRRTDANATYNLSTISVRTIPVSQFTLFSRATTTLSSKIFTAGDAGRLYSGADLLISDGEVVTQYPVVAAGQVAVVNDGVIQARATPRDEAPYTFRSSTSDQDWPALAKSVAGSRVLSGRDLPLSVMRPAVPAALVATPESEPPSYPSPDQRLYPLCQRTLLITVSGGERGGGGGIGGIGGIGVSEDEYKFRSYSGSMGANYQGEPLNESGEQEVVAACVYNSPNWRQGPVIVFDYSKLRSVNALYTSYYIAANHPNAVILIRGARILQGPFSLVTPHPIYVENGLGDYDTAQQPVTQSQFPVSLVTQDRIYACKTGW